MKFAVCVLTSLWREWDMAGRNPVCRKSCLIECHQCWGSLGRSVWSSCLEPWPCVPAGASGPRQRLREAAWRSLQDTFPMAGAWQRDGEAGGVCVCAQPQGGARCRAQVCCLPWSTQAPPALGRASCEAPLQVSSDAGTAASFLSPGKEEFSEMVFIFLGNNRKA